MCTIGMVPTKATQFQVGEFHKVQLVFYKMNPDGTKYKYENLCNDIFKVTSFSIAAKSSIVALLSSDIHNHQFLGTQYIK